ncbi:MAG TPA: hypothetical protein VIK57_23340 [Streptosporangiaceae bacterium]
MAGGKGVLGAGGGLGTGLLLLVGGLVVKHAQANVLAECSSGLGRFGALIDPNAASECSSAKDLSTMATGGIWIGAIMLVFTVGGFLVVLIAAANLAASKKPRTVATGAGSVVAAGRSAAPPQRLAASTGEVPDPATPPGRGCGHGKRPEALFCTVCGRPAESAPSAAPAAGWPAPAPDLGLTAVSPAVPLAPPPPPQPLPPGPRPSEPLSPPIATDWAAPRSFGDPGASPRSGWGEPPPDPGGDFRARDAWEQPHVPPAPGNTHGDDDAAHPHQSGRRRSAWPLAAAGLLVVAGVVAVFLLHPSQKSQAGIAASATSSAAVRQPVSVSGTAAAASSPASSPQQSADRLGALLAQSVADRRSIVNAVNSVSQCGPALSEAPRVFENAAGSRQRLLTELASLPGRSTLSSQMISALTGAWRSSAEADRDFAQWAQGESSQGCTPNDQSDLNFQAAAAPDRQATMDKKAFARAWDPVAAQYGLISYQWDQL